MIKKKSKTDREKLLQHRLGLEYHTTAEMAITNKSKRAERGNEEPEIHISNIQFDFGVRLDIWGADTNMAIYTHISDICTPECPISAHIRSIIAILKGPKV